MRKKLRMQITSSGPDSDWDSIRQLYFMLITEAENKVYIQSPYFVPGPSVYLALKTAALSGRDVRIMITGIPDKKLPFWAAFTYFEGLLKAGVRIYHYKKGFLHSKTITVDGELCSVGTANMDIRSFQTNYEVNALIYDQEIARKIERQFKTDLRSCEEFTLEKYQRIPTIIKLRNSISRLLAPLL
jgi:cardiolipin synthase